jgi:hypothetical protein
MAEPDEADSAWDLESGFRFVNGRLGKPAFGLIDLAQADLALYQDRGTVIHTIEGFFTRLPGRNVKQRNANGQTVDHQRPASMPAGIAPTQWDIDATALWTTATNPVQTPAQKLRIEVRLGEGVRFFPPSSGVPAITAKTAASADRLVNLEVDLFEGKPRAVFHAILPGGTAPSFVGHGFNIAVVMRDAGDSRLSLPIIIDPTVRNYG